MSNIPNLTKRASLTKASKDDIDYHVAQVDYLGKVCDVEIITPYGLYSTSPEGSIVTIWNVQGQEENRVGISNTPELRYKNLLPGEVVVGSPQTLTNVKFKTDGSLVITGKNQAVVTIDSSGNISVSTDGTLTMHSKGNMAVTSDGNINMTATGHLIMAGSTIELNGNSLPISTDMTVKTN